MDEDNDEEDRVEVGNTSSGTDNGTPVEAHNPVGGVVGLARPGPGAAGQETVTVGGLDKGGVLDNTTGKLGESLAELVDALGLHLEVTLLGHGNVEAALE